MACGSKEASRRLEHGSLTKAEGLKDLANVAEKLEKRLADAGQNPALKPLHKAARESDSSSATASPAALRKQFWYERNNASGRAELESAKSGQPKNK